MLRLRKIKMPDGTTSFSCKVILDATCKEEGLDQMLGKIRDDTNSHLEILALNIPHCDEAKIDSNGNLHTKTGAI